LIPVAILTIVVVVLLILIIRHHTTTPTLIFAILSGIGFVAATTWGAAAYDNHHANIERRVENRPIQDPQGGFVGSNRCQQCHVDKHASWYASYHRTMTQIADPQSIATSFADVRFESGNRHYKLFESEGKLWTNIETVTPKGTSSHVFQIVLTTGSHHYQVYWFETTQPRALAQLPYVFLIDEQKWVPRTSVFLIPPAEPPSTGKIEALAEYGRWNTTCIRCHATAGVPKPVNINGTERFDTRVAEFGISCEMCHGPGGTHSEKMSNPITRYSHHLSGADAQEIVNPSKLSAQKSSQICGQCHSINMLRSHHDELDWRSNGYKYRPGDDLNAHRIVVERGELQAEGAFKSETQDVEDPSFWGDGMVRVAGREYNGLLHSPCYAGGEFSCLTCHALHKDADDGRSNLEWANDQLAHSALDNSVCTECHAEFGSSPAAVSAHTGHETGSPGSLCYDCHMPYTSYGLRKAVRSHQISSPNVNDSLRYGRPNACNQCHLDKTLRWTADALDERYGQPAPEIPSALADTSYTVIHALSGDAAQRALAFYSMGNSNAQDISGSQWLTPFLAQGLNDPYVVVRQIAHRSLQTLAGFTGVEYDFQADEAAREHAIARIMGAWSDGRPKYDNPEILMAKGTLEIDLLEAILRQRDNSPIAFPE
jgi:hypothetical protein